MPFSRATVQVRQSGGTGFLKYLNQCWPYLHILGASLLWLTCDITTLVRGLANSVKRFRGEPIQLIVESQVIIISK